MEEHTRRTWVLLLGSITAVLLVVVGITAVVSLWRVRSQDSGTVGVTGNREQWSSAVCAEHSVMATSANFLYPDATNIAYCVTKPSDTMRPQPVVIGEWPLDGDLSTGIARLRSVHWFATAPVGDHLMVFILRDSPDRTLLEPLIPFGFTISAT